MLPEVSTTKVMSATDGEVLQGSLMEVDVNVNQFIYWESITQLQQINFDNKE